MHFFANFDVHSISMRILSLLIVVAVLTGSSCKTKKPVAEKPFGKDPALENVRWQLTEINGAAPKGLPAGKPIDLVFEGASNTFGGSSGCNQCNGMYTTQDDLIKLHMMAVTKMACEDMQAEQAWLALMEKIDHYTLEKKKEKGVEVQYLILKAGDQVVAKMKAGTM